MDLQLRFLLSVVWVSSPTSLETNPQLKTNLGSFLPVTLEQLAREQGVLWSDKTTSCVAKKAAEEGAQLLVRAAEKDNNHCVVNVLGAEITTSSFAMYTFSLAVFVQALALVSFSSVADHGELLVCSETVIKLMNSRQLPEEAAAGIWLYRCYYLDAVSPGCPQDIPDRVHLGYHRSNMSRFLLRHPQLVLTIACGKHGPE